MSNKVCSVILPITQNSMPMCRTTSKQCTATVLGSVFWHSPYVCLACMRSTRAAAISVLKTLAVWLAAIPSILIRFTTWAKEPKPSLRSPESCHRSSQCLTSSSVPEPSVANCDVQVCTELWASHRRRIVSLVVGSKTRPFPLFSIVLAWLAASERKRPEW